jgi:hypothetical protein
LPAGASSDKQDRLYEMALCTPREMLEVVIREGRAIRLTVWLDGREIVREGNLFVG